MNLVNVKCPNCGASIQLDNDRTEGFCSYCGSKIKVQDALSFIKIDKTSDLKNFMNLSQTAIDGNNGKEALDYANKALELDSSNGEAWYLKMRAIALIAVLGDLKCGEIIAAGEKAIQYSSDAEMPLNVYKFYLLQCLNSLDFCIQHLLDTDAMKELLSANAAVNFMNAIERTMQADEILNIIISQEQSILNLRLAVPNDQIPLNGDLTEGVTAIAQQWVAYQSAIDNRFNIYKTSISDEALQEYKKNLALIKQGLPEENKQQINEQYMTNETGGCYVATAVYGSYNCPEVWTLRRFRDYVLAEHLTGRCFIRIYYALSPTFVKIFGKSKLLKSTLKPILDSVVCKLQQKGIEDSPYQDRIW